MTTYLDELVQKITTKADLKGFDDLDKKQKRAIKQNNLLARSFKTAFGMFLGVQGVRSIVEVSRKYDLMQKSLKGLTKSADDFKYLRREAYRTGSDLLTIAGSYKNFYAAASGAGFQRGAIQGMFSNVLVAGRGIGASQQQIGAALLALEQMLSKGKVSAQELRLQLGNALPGAMQIAARAMNMTTAELDEMMRKGMLISSVFVPKFTEQLKKELGGGFEEAIKSLDFALVNLSTAWQEFQVELLQGEAGQALAGFIKEITAVLRSQTLLNTVKLIGKALGLIIKNLKWILVFWGAGKIVQLANGVMRLHRAIVATASSTAALGVVTRTLASGYAFLTGGQVLRGLAMIRAGLWALVAPTLILSAKIAAIVAAILLVQDMLLTLADPEADTYTRGLSNHLKDTVDTKNPTPTQIPFANPSVTQFGASQIQIRDEDTLPYKFKQWRAKHSKSAAVTGNYNGTYSKSNQQNQNNHIAINVFAQPGQSEQAIGEAVVANLGMVLDNYVMVT